MAIIAAFDLLVLRIIHLFESATKRKSITPFIPPSREYSTHRCEVQVEMQDANISTAASSNAN
jgi:hypothetical protein